MPSIAYGDGALINDALRTWHGKTPAPHHLWSGMRECRTGGATLIAVLGSGPFKYSLHRQVIGYIMQPVAFHPRRNVLFRIAPGKSNAADTTATDPTIGPLALDQSSDLLARITADRH